MKGYWESSRTCLKAVRPYVYIVIFTDKWKTVELGYRTWNLGISVTPSCLH